MSTILADTVFVNGSVFLSADAAPADAVAVQSGRIVHVGRGGLPEFVGPATEVVDMQGGSLLPGFQDAHVHPVAAGIQGLTCDLSREPHSRERYLRAIRDYADAHTGEAWVTGNGWYGDAFPGGLPMRHDLDTVIPDRPAVFTSHDGHGVWVNSRALAVAGIDSATADPDGGRIDRDAAGVATGILVEKAGELVTGLLPPITDDVMDEALLAAQSHLHSLGITAWQDAGVGIPLFGFPDNLGSYLRLDADRTLTARVIGALWWSADRGLAQLDDIRARRAQSGTTRFHATTVKVMQDGICENCTAAMLSPYTSVAAGAEALGASFIEPDDLAKVVDALVGDQFQIHMHAVGDRAVRECLDALEFGIRSHPQSDGRHQIAHLDVVDPEDIPRFAELGVIANIQALWARRDTEIVERKLPLLGAEREKWHFPFRSLHGSGARLAMGSDWPVTDPNPLWAIHTAVTRTGPKDDPHAIGDEARTVPLGPDQALDLRTAIEAYTLGSAYANHLDHVTGTVEVGKLADLVLLDQDVFAAEDVSTIRPTLTMVEGRTVYRAD
ncbi:MULTISPECIES: amidohydrolase [unclassified Rhodococcus (in: high G+C Gram-positive bacteria)]|jgi:predicted amidohydrolase YtcJ|uniref:amidohydrolase n=1 Tax=unclassified Rhodococcus (in: high G+C Gram-positive bacteria) TaxID=192944 RepID=UPI00077A07E4|nr:MULTISPECIES: amidohydrolase [unclassified Rhodococcus (in: high G+C Gram-positive bacteria)]KXX58216.1 peptidase [Rhodococcus sp. LB1]PBC49634.1 amidohydrolase [Rhodococcus sp. ACPA1]